MSSMRRSESRLIGPPVYHYGARTRTRWREAVRSIPGSCTNKTMLNRMSKAAGAQADDTLPTASLSRRTTFDVELKETTAGRQMMDPDPSHTKKPCVDSEDARDSSKGEANPVNGPGGSIQDHQPVMNSHGGGLTSTQTRSGQNQKVHLGKCYYKCQVTHGERPSHYMYIGSGGIRLHPFPISKKIRNGHRSLCSAAISSQLGTAYSDPRLLPRPLLYQHPIKSSDLPSSQLPSPSHSQPQTTHSKPVPLETQCLSVHRTNDQNLFFATTAVVVL